MLVKEYRAYLKLEKGLSVNSVDAYLRDYQRLKDYADVHGIDVVHASFDDLQAFVFDTFKEIASVGTQARLVAGIHSFYRFLLYHHYIEQDPSELLETPKKELHLPDVLSLEEIDRMIAQIDMSKSTYCYDEYFSFLFPLQEVVQHRIDHHNEQEQHQCDGEQRLPLQTAGVGHFGSHSGGEETDGLKQRIRHIGCVTGNHHNRHGFSNGTAYT